MINLFRNSKDVRVIVVMTIVTFFYYVYRSVSTGISAKYSGVTIDGLGLAVKVNIMNTSIFSFTFYQMKVVVYDADGNEIISTLPTNTTMKHGVTPTIFKLPTTDYMDVINALVIGQFSGYSGILKFNAYGFIPVSIRMF